MKSQRSPIGSAFALFLTSTVFFALAACGKSEPESSEEPIMETPAGELAVVTLLSDIHFIAPDGGNVIVTAGDYRLQEDGENLALVSVDGGQPIIIAAERAVHDEELTDPTAIYLDVTADDEEDLKSIALFLPDGELMEATGTKSGIRTRGLLGCSGTISERRKCRQNTRPVITAVRTKRQENDGVLGCSGTILERRECRKETRPIKTKVQDTIAGWAGILEPAPMAPDRSRLGVNAFNTVFQADAKNFNAGNRYLLTYLATVVYADFLEQLNSARGGDYHLNINYSTVDALTEYPGQFLETFRARTKQLFGASNVQYTFVAGSGYKGPGIRGERQYRVGWDPSAVIITTDDLAIVVFRGTDKDQEWRDTDLGRFMIRPGEGTNLPGKVQRGMWKSLTAADAIAHPIGICPISSEVKNFRVSDELIVIWDSHKRLVTPKDTFDGNSPAMDDLFKGKNIDLRTFQLAGNRIAVLDKLHTLHVQEGNLGAPFIAVKGGVSKFQLAGNRIGVLVGDTLQVKEGRLDARWVSVKGGVSKFQLAGNRIGVLVGDTLQVKEGRLDARWVSVKGGVSKFQLAGNRIGVLVGDTLQVKEGGLDARWVSVKGGVSKFQLAGNRIAVLVGDTLQLKEGGLNAPWVAVKGGVSRFQLLDNQLAVQVGQKLYVSNGQKHWGKFAKTMHRELKCFEDKKLWITGHSLGGAHAQLLAAYLSAKDLNLKATGVYAIASPHIGNNKLVEKIEEFFPDKRLQRFEFMDDIVTLLPKALARAGCRVALGPFSGTYPNLTSHRAVCAKERTRASNPLQTTANTAFHYPHWYLWAAYGALDGPQKGMVPDHLTLPIPRSRVNENKPSNVYDFPPPRALKKAIARALQTKDGKSTGELNE